MTLALFCWITCMSQTWGGPRLDPVTTLRPSVAIRQQSTRTSSPAAPGVTAPLEVALYCTIWFPAWFAIIVRTFWTCEKSIFLELKFCFHLFKSYDKSKSGGIYISWNKKHDWYNKQRHIENNDNHLKFWILIFLKAHVESKILSLKTKNIETFKILIST